MVKNPDVQAKAQAELDTVIGKGNLPTFDDEEALPYITAIMKECFRWQTAISISIPHMVTTDDVYKGLLIPAGTVVIPNTWYEDLYAMFYIEFNGR